MNTRLYLSTLILVLAFQSADAKVTLATSEPTRFVSVADSKLLGVDKNSDFIGVLNRETKSGIERSIDVYEIKGRSDLKMTKVTCTKIAEMIVGPFQKNPLKLLSFDLKPSASTGRICVFAFSDPDPKAQVKEKHLLINILNLHVMAYMFRYGKTATAAQAIDELAFVESLRIGPAPLQ